MRNFVTWALVALTLAFAALTAEAQTALTAPSIKWAGVWGTTTPNSLIGYDSGTGAPCVIGSSATCSLAIFTPSGALPTTGYSAQFTVTASAQQLPSQVFSAGPIITAFTTNSASICFGWSNAITLTSGSYCIVPGQSIAYALGNISALWYIGGNTTDKFEVTGT